MQIFWQDVRHAMRMLTKNRVFTVVAIITLALGIGANAAIFSVLDAVLLKPLPYDDPDRLLVLSERRPDGQRNTVSVANFLDWQRENKVFTQVSATFSNSFNLSGTEQPEKISGMFVTANHFDVLGAKPAFGRTFQPDEDQAGHARVVVISHRLWQQLFAPDRNLLGKELILDGDRYAVIGVLKPDTNFDRAVAQLYVPLTFDANRSDRRSHFLRVYARLKYGVTLPQAQTEMDAIAATIAHQSPDTNKGWGITLDKLSDRVGSPQLRQTVSVLFGAVVFVLLIACANLANLLLARTTDRYKEISIRAALGAARGRLVRQFLTESIVLSLLGGTAGLALAIWLVQLFSSLMPPLTLPPEAQLALDYRVVLFTFGASLLTGLFIGLIPAWQASKHDLSEALKEGGKNSTAASSGRYVSNLLIISEVSLALVLLIGSVLLMRNILHLRETRLGFETANTLTMHVSLPGTKYKTPAQMEAFYSQALHRITTLPGVLFASTVSDIPMRGWTFGEAFEVEGQPVSSESKINGAHYQRISPDYFKTLSIPLLEGRYFTSQDQPTNTPVIIINETLARRFFPNEHALGKRLIVDNKAREIVGITGNVHVYGLGDQLPEENPEIFVPHAQEPSTGSYFVIRASVDPAQLAPALRREIRALDPDQPVTKLLTMDQVVSETLADEKFNTLLVGMFAALAVSLAFIGIYGIISYVVAQHTREIGIRMALGAQSADVLKLIVGRGIFLTTIGIALGLGLAYAVTRVLARLLHGVSTTDQFTFLLAPFLLALIAVVACYIPARRATKIDPLIALRSE